jgi:hypothetical protein
MHSLLAVHRKKIPCGQAAYARCATPTGWWTRIGLWAIERSSIDGLFPADTGVASARLKAGMLHWLDSTPSRRSIGSDSSKGSLSNVSKIETASSKDDYTAFVYAGCSQAWYDSGSQYAADMTIALSSLINVVGYTVGIDRRLFCRLTIGSFTDQPSETSTCEKITKQWNWRVGLCCKRLSSLFCFLSLLLCKEYK